MARNPIQFQHGLSLPDFLAEYGTEEQCYAALTQLRWPDGFRCPECGGSKACKLARGAWQCHRCHHQCSLTAGTIFHSTKLPLATWFLAIYLLTQRKKSISALQLRRELGVNYNTAWRIKHKVMQVMLERNQSETLHGRIEIDDAYLGGERSGKRGRGAEHKLPFVAAVETSEEGHPLRIQLRRVASFSLKAMGQYAGRSVSVGSHVVSDGLGCFRAFDQRNYTHERIVTGGGKASVEIPAFKRVNTMVGNVKNALVGTVHSLSEAHSPRYLAEFEYRFNRRFDLPEMIERFAFVAVRTPPMPARLLKLAESYG